MAKSPGRLRAAWRALTRPLVHPLTPSADPFSGDPPDMTARQRYTRVFRGLAHRLLLAPVLVAGCMALLVLGSTHRVPVVNASGYPTVNPTSINTFYRDVEIMTAEGVRLAGWHIPAWSARHVAAGGENGLIEPRPGLVLCHGAWSDRTQMLYLVPALHEAGFELLLIDLRGCGASEGSISLGLNEWRDIRAAVRWLQELSQVDSQRIGVIATDANAAAALQAASGDPAIRVVVADRPSCTMSSFLERRFDSMGLPGGSLGRLYSWSLALTQRTEVGSASAVRWAEELSPRQALLVTARRDDPSVPSGEPLIVSWAARGPKELRLNPFPGDRPGLPAVMPGDLVRFLAEHMKPLPPEPARQPIAELTEPE